MRGFITLETSLAQRLRVVRNEWEADTKLVPYVLQTLGESFHAQLQPSVDSDFRDNY